MKNKILFFILFFVTIEYSFCQDNDTIIGKVISINNPCTTDPCLPGGVLALQSDTLSYILTVDHKWNIDSFNVDGRYIKIDDSIQVIGIIYERVDLKDKIYYEIEIEEVLFFDITTIKNNKNTQIEIFPNPTTGAISIISDSNKLLKITVQDLGGKVLLSQDLLSNNLINISSFEPGLYILTVESDNAKIKIESIVKY